MMDGRIKPGQKIKFMRTGREYSITEMGQFRPGMEKCDELAAGQVGYFTANIKNIEYVNIGDTVTDAANPTAEPLAGYKEPKPMVYSGLYPVNNNEFEDLREALGKLKLNDSSFTYSPEVSDGLGFGFRCGFLGMLHREIIQQRLEQDSTSTSSRPRPTSPTRSRRRTAPSSPSARRTCRTPGSSRSSASRS